MESVKCKKCNSVDDYTTSNSGPHVRADCARCGAFIKFLPQHTEPICYLPKYKGKPIKEIDDADWLAWVLKNVPLKSKDLLNYSKQLETLITI